MNAKKTNLTPQQENEFFEDVEENLMENILQEEQNILEKPIVDIKGFNKARRAEVKELKSELDKMIGNKNALVEIAIQKED